MTASADEAQEALGCLYEFAEKPDYRHARKWYTHALKQHSSDTPDAAYRLGYLYEKGLAGKKDIKQPASSTEKQPKRVAPKPNAPSVTYTIKVSVCPEAMPKPTNGTPAPPYK